MRFVRRAGDLALWISALLGGLCLVLVLLGLTLGVRPLIFTSGSMSPAIDTGALALAHREPASDLRVGDVVSVPIAGGRVTHRIVAITDGADGSATLRLRGDANATPDPQSYTVSSADRVWFAVPRLGSAVAWLSSAPGIYLLAAYGAMLVVLIVRRAPRGGSGADPSGTHPRRRRWTRPGVAVLMAAILGPVSIGAAPAWAFWTDDVQVTGSTLTATTIPQVSGLACQLTDANGVGFMGLDISATVPPSGGPFSYQIQLAHFSTPNQVIWTHPLTPSGSGLAYSFVQSDITIDRPNEDGVHVDYYVRIVVSLTSDPDWQSVTMINIDAANEPGVLGIGAGVYYGSLQGTNSPGGEPGQCTD